MMWLNSINMVQIFSLHLEIGKFQMTLVIYPERRLGHFSESLIMT